MKKVLVLMAGLLLIGANLYAGNGDLIVNGNLGVGTTTPQAKLDVRGSIIAANTDFVNASAGSFLQIQQGASSGNTYSSIGAYSAGGTSSNNLILQTASGYVGIGTTSPGQRVTVDAPNGQPATIGTTQNGVLRLQVDQGIGWGEVLDMGMHIGISGPPSYAWLQATNKGGLGVIYNMALNPNGGNVGIGTTGPQYTLDVAGTTRSIEGYLTSDIRLKKNILPMDGALNKILKLNGVSYEWKHGKDFEGETLEALKTDEDGKVKDDKYRDLPEGRTLGVIAQELEQVLPEAVNTSEDGIKAVSYTKIIPVLIEAMKEQQKQITAQIDKIKDQQKRIEELEKKVAQLK